MYTGRNEKHTRTKRSKLFWDRVEDADRNPKKNWYALYLSHRCKTRHYYWRKYDVPGARTAYKILATKPHPRNPGRVGCYQFTADMENAFNEFDTPEWEKTEVALEYTDFFFGRWVRRQRLGPNDYIPWREFTEALFTYVMALEH